MIYFFLQVSAEPDGATYVFQGSIHGKDYGQFGLRSIGKYLKSLNLVLWH